MKTNSKIALLVAAGLFASPVFADTNSGDVNPDQTAVQVPVGGDDNRPQGADGLVRYNADQGVLEAFVKGEWTPILTAPKAEGEEGAEGDKAHGFYNPLNDLAKLKASVAKLESLGLFDVNTIKTKLAAIEKEYLSLKARLLKLEQQFNKK